MRLRIATQCFLDLLAMLFGFADQRMLLRMEPRELLRLLMKGRGLNTTSLCNACGAKQPQIHRFLSGTAREPRRSTLAPVAAYFGIPVDSLCNEDSAQKAAQSLGLLGCEVSATAANKLLAASKPPQQQPIDPDDVIERLGMLLAQVPTQYRASVADTLAIYAKEGGADFYRPALVAILGKRRNAA